MTTAQRRRINRENASHSKGPISDEGKSRSRRNALKHGLRAEELTLPNEDPTAVSARVADWNDHYQPRNPGEQHLVDLCVQSSLLSDRCARHQTAVVAKQVREAPRRYDEACADEVRRFMALLATEPAAAVRGLEQSAAGCRALIARWHGLRLDLDRRGYWLDIDRDDALRLLGDRPDDFKGGVLTFTVCVYNLQARGVENPDTLAWYLNPARVPERFRGRLARVPESWLPTAEAARDFLRTEIETALTRLEAREAWLRLDFEAPDRAEAADRALLPIDPDEARLFLRYQAESRGTFHRAYTALLKSLAADDPGESIEPALTVAVETTEIVEVFPAASAPLETLPEPAPIEPTPADECPDEAIPAPEPAAAAVSPNEPKRPPEPPSNLEEETTSDEPAAPVSTPPARPRAHFTAAEMLAMAEAGTLATAFRDFYAEARL